jgi:hypothetical protein
MTKPGEKMRLGDKIKLPLEKPIKAHGKEITYLEFRYPSGEDLLEIGSPNFAPDMQGHTHFDFAITGQYIVRLADVPLSTVKQMAPIDMMKAVGVVAGFFRGLGQTQTNSSEDTSS